MLLALAHLIELEGARAVRARSRRGGDLMCGICGQVRSDGRPVDRSVLEAMCDRQRAPRPGLPRAPPRAGASASASSACG